MKNKHEIIKYFSGGLVIWLMTKAFVGDKVENNKITSLTIIIVIIAYLLCDAFNKCDMRERYEGLNDKKPSDEDVFMEPNNENEDDIENMKKVFNIDEDKYNDVIARENEAKEKIKSNYKYDMKYTNSNPLNTKPLGASIYGYTFLPPENWFRAYEAPPVCITDKRSAVVPIIGSSTEGLMEFDNN